MNYSIFDFPIVGGYLKRVSCQIEKLGLQEATRKEFKRSGSQLKIYGFDKNLKEILENKPVVLVSNHPFALEPTAVLASLPSRNNFSFIINSIYLHLFPDLDKYLIPVYLRHHFKGNRSKLDAFCVKIIDKLNPTPRFTSEIEYQKNREAVSLAAKKVKLGCLVYITPEKHSKEKGWHKGLGFLLKEIGPLKKGFYVKAYVKNTSPWDLLRLFPYLGRFLPTLKVYFAKPQKIAEVFEEDAKKLTAKLEKEYNQWVKTF